MPVEDTLVTTLRELNKTMNRLTRSGSLGAGTGTITGLRGFSGMRAGSSVDVMAKQIAEEKALTKATKDSYTALKALKASLDGAPSAFDNTLKNQAELTSRLMNSAIDRLSYDELAKLPEAFEKQLERNTDAVTKHMRGQFRTLDDLLRLPLRARKLEDEATLERLDQIREEYKQSGENIATAEKLNDELKHLGLTVNELGDSNEEVIKQTKVALETLGETSIKTGHSVKGLLARLTKIAGGVAAASAPWIHLARVTSRLGGDFDAVSHVLMGMSPEELIQLQQDHRQAILSSNLTMDQFNEKVKEGASGLISYTGSLKDGIRVNAANLDNARFLGVEQQNQTTFMGKQTDMFKFLNRVVGTTAEEFTEMNKRLLQSESVRSNLYRLNVQQRSAYIEDLQLTRQRLVQGGMMMEQAERMTEVFAEIGAKSPRERLKEAAKLQAIAGAMGLGGISAEAGAIVRRAGRGKGDTERMIEIQKQLQGAMSQMMSSGLPGELQAFAMQEATGMQQYFGGPFQDLELQRTKALTDEQAKARLQTRAIGDEMVKVLHTADILKAGAENPMLQSLAGIGYTTKEILGLLRTSGMGMGGMSGAGALTGGGAITAGRLATAGAAGAAAFGLYELGKSIITGESDVSNALYSLEGGIEVMDAIGGTLHQISDNFDETLSKLAHYLTSPIQATVEMLTGDGGMMKKIDDGLQKQVDATNKAVKKLDERKEQAQMIAQDEKRDKEKEARMMWTRSRTK